MNSQFYVQHLTDPSKRNWSGNLNINFFATVDRIISDVSDIVTSIVLNSLMIMRRQFSK